MIDAMELSHKDCKCSSGGLKDNKHHYYPAGLCIIVVLRRLSYPCTFMELVDVFGNPSHRLAGMYHAAVDYIFFRFRFTIVFQTRARYFARFASVFREYRCPYTHMVG